jgi:predicted transcriptional regulator
MTSDDQPQADQSKINGIGHQVTDDQPQKPDATREIVRIYTDTNGERWLNEVDVKAERDALEETAKMYARNQDYYRQERDAIQKRCEEEVHKHHCYYENANGLIARLLRENDAAKEIIKSLEKENECLRNAECGCLDELDQAKAREQKLVAVIRLALETYTPGMTKTILQEALKEIKGE